MSGRRAGGAGEVEGTGGGGEPGEEMGSEGGGGRRREPRLFVRPSVWSVATGGGGRGVAPPPP